MTKQNCRNQLYHEGIYLGEFNSVDELPSHANIGDSCIVQNDYYVWDTYHGFVNYGPVILEPHKPTNKTSPAMTPEEKALIEALAYLRTLSHFGGTLQQSRELANKGIERINTLLESSERRNS